MPRSSLTTARDKVTRAKHSIVKIESMLEEARRDARRAILVAYEAGMSQTQLAELWGTSQTRMRENIVRAKAEREGLI